MDIISRGEWGARSPKAAPVRVDWSVRTLFVVHYTGAARSQTIQELQAYCMDAPNKMHNDIDYNFAVKDGLIYEGRGWDVVGAHSLDYNRVGIGVVVFGESGDATEADLAAVRWLWEESTRRKGSVLSPRTHGQLNSTDCAGAQLNAWVAGGMLVPGAPQSPFPGTPPWPGQYFRYVPGRPMLRSDNVRRYQQRLQDRGWKIVVDGIYGPKTRAVTIAFQKEKGIEVDGVVGRQTWATVFRTDNVT